MSGCQGFAVSSTPLQGKAECAWCCDGPQPPSCKHLVQVVEFATQNWRTVLYFPSQHLIESIRISISVFVLGNDSQSHYHLRSMLDKELCSIQYHPILGDLSTGGHCQTTPWPQGKCWTLFETAPHVEVRVTLICIDEHLNRFQTDTQVNHHLGILWILGLWNSFHQFSFVPQTATVFL